MSFTHYSEEDVCSIDGKYARCTTQPGYPQYSTKSIIVLYSESVEGPFRTLIGVEYPQLTSVEYLAVCPKYS